MCIQALVFADSKEIKEHCVGLGAGDDLYALFAAILTMRPWDKIVDRSIDHLIVPDTPEEREELQVRLIFSALLLSFPCTADISRADEPN